MTTPITPRRPRIRVGAVLYGLVAIAASSGLLAISADPALRAAVVERGLALEPGAVVALIVAAFGAIALLLGVTHVLDRRSGSEAD
ncbi:hypothetical protein [Rathayibacter iranicus]|uniref:Uncharacterized protein n=2 Tax=Rathayibacter iranicus TaxID=59737 RepID=A0AAD1EN00_9MICO|nr:hypothetical protein [Rathayibacter iranicus]AZZ56638.1 hypothetical protein C7V51_12705 [Rathayibacter iranicus]MWV31329.1 hypothetical protein [Rathayibacter iranicus NCPPB 2253 = VKM Ac-1602]PPI43283.1 hypothetical protein C5E09_11625 [Rathayibacter iranicus]PPI58226.1 hypothetical protein C5E08_12540 [Rathayibacter iranicus]PPI69439.1 hypothetical protein C5E01_11585 [Rathayibacter iranicus]